MNDFETLTPKKIVEELDRFIIGQTKAKKAVAIALRNRIRRMKLAPEDREEIAPKNILMIGPTGVGKTEIARRLAKLCNAPFVKVEATKYTEVGYVGRDVESMIRDLMAAGYRMVMEELREEVLNTAQQKVTDRILDALLPGVQPQTQSENVITPNPTREWLKGQLERGELDDREIEIEVTTQNGGALEIFAGQPFEDLESTFSGIAGLFGGKGKKKRRMKIREARNVLLQEESEKLIDKDKATEIARERVEQNGIIFVDEIDKIASRAGQTSSIDVSREGVQRDILPIVEGSKVSTRYGIVDTTHILFIAAGAFTVSKPTDLIPELQGRFPIRVELDSLNAADFEKILIEPENSLIRQYTQLLETESVKLTFTPQAIHELAVICEQANKQTENIGARRLHTIMEHLLEDISFSASEKKGETVTIDEAFVAERFKGIFERPDLAKFIL